MRAIAAALLAIVLSACAAPPTAAPPTASPTAGPVTAAPTAVPPTALPTALPTTLPTASPSAGPTSAADALLALMPSTAGGVATTRTSLSPTGRNSPKVFLKVIGRLGKKPTEARLALAFGSGATVYAMQVDGLSGGEIAQAFLDERANTDPGSSLPPTVSIGGRQVIRFGVLVGTFLYPSGDTFFYVEAPGDAAAADVLAQLP